MRVALPSCLLSVFVLGATASAQEAPHTQFYDPVPAPFEGEVSATPRDPAPISLRPDVSCESNICTIRMKTKFGGTTSLSEPLPYKGRIYDGDDWFPRAYPKDKLPEGVSYGWTVGYDEGETDIFVTDMLYDKWDQANSGRFLVEQRAGFEHVGRHFKVFATDPKTEELYTAFDFPHIMGPVVVRMEPYAMDGVLISYDWYSEDIPTPYPGSIFYEWVEKDNGRLTLAIESEESTRDHYHD